MSSLANRMEHQASVILASFHRRADRLRIWLARKTLAIIIAVLLLLSSSPDRARAAAGDLDPTFDADGKVLTSFFGSSDVIAALAIQSDGRIVAAGRSAVSPLTVNFLVARYNTDGSLDSGFGAGGKVTTDFPGGTGATRDVAIQGDGRIVVAGTMRFSPSNTDFALARYNTDGTLDATFGTGGKVTTHVGPNDAVTGLAVQADGKIVAVGYTASGSTFDDIVILRYQGNGNLDNTFGAGGVVITDFTGANNRAGDVVIQTDGRIVAAGLTEISPSSSEIDFALARYNPDGTLDSSFGTGGRVMTNFFGNSNDGINDLAIQTDGRILVLGITTANSTNATLSNFALARYNTNGSLDLNFGTGGKVITDFQDRQDFATGLAIQSDGRIVAVGDSYIPTDVTTSNFTLARYNSDGSLDTTFGIDGTVSTDFLGQTDMVSDVAIQADDKIVTAGYAYDGVTTVISVALARYNCSESADLSVAKSALLNPVVAGRSLTYTINLTNNGPDAAVNVTLSDLTPPATTFQALTAPPGWSCTTPAVGETGAITCTTASLLPGHLATLTLIVQVSPLAPDGARVDNRVIVSSDTPDPALNNNRASVTTFVIGFPVCLQDDQEGDTLQLNPTTGDYRFTRCGAGGFTLVGQGVINSQGCTLSLSDSAPGHTVEATVDTCSLKGKATIEVSEPKLHIKLKDKDISDNACACP